MAYQHLYADPTNKRVHEDIELIFSTGSDRMMSNAKIVQVVSKHAPKQRMGYPQVSHKASKRQRVENDFSPPLSDKGSFLWPCDDPWA